MVLRTLMADTIARLSVCRDAGVPVERGLLDDALTCLRATLEDAALIERRNEYIRRAAILLPGTDYGRAGRLAHEAKALARTAQIGQRRDTPDQLTSPRDWLFAASKFAALPASPRQYYRLLVRRD